MVWREVKPWRRELREDISFVSADLGPRDLAPLARAVSDLSCDGMCGAPGFRLHLWHVWIKRSFWGFLPTLWGYSCVRAGYQPALRKARQGQSHAFYLICF